MPIAVLIHVCIALSSVLFTTYLFVSPSKTKFYISYGLIGLTLASGTYLVVTMPAHIMSACESGLAYIGIMLFGLIAARHRLTKVSEDLSTRRYDNR
jgi:hypothetical protein